MKVSQRGLTEWVGLGLNVDINIPCAEGLDRIREKPGKPAEPWFPSFLVRVM